MGEHDEAVGIWSLKLGTQEFEIKPKVGDNRKFRRIIMSRSYEKDRAAMLDAFEDWFSELIFRDYPHKDKEEIKYLVEFNSMNLFQETLIKFGYQTKEQMEENRKLEAEQLKKLM